MKIQSKSSDLLFGIRSDYFISNHCDNLITTLEMPDMSIAKTQKLSRCAVDMLVSQRKESKFNVF